MRKLILLAAILFAIGLAVGCKHKIVDDRPSAIVRLTQSETGQFFCSGTVVDAHWIVTAAHCMPQNPLVAMGLMSPQNLPPGITVTDGSGAIRAEVESIYYDGRSDQALMKGDFSAFQTMQMVSDPNIIIAMLTHKIIACGYPYGGRMFCSKFTYEHNRLFQISGPGFLYPGMSGGPVIDTESGKVIGVNTAVAEDGDVILSPLVDIWDNLGVPNEQIN